MPAEELRTVVKRAVPFALTLGDLVRPVPAGLTEPAWHLFAIFAGAIVCRHRGCVSAAHRRRRLAVAAAGRSRARSCPPRPSRASRTPVCSLVIVAFLVARAVVKSGLGRRISLIVVSAFGAPRLDWPTASFSPTRRSLPRSRAIPPAAACSSRSSLASPRVPARCRMTRDPSARRLPHVLRDGESRRSPRPSG